MQDWNFADSTGLPGNSPADHRMVWAIDTASGMLVHIGELPADRRGMKSGCACCACEAPLTAINAATNAEDRRRRPHFRHPKGTERDSCLIVSARHAAMELFKKQGQLDLPSRRYTARVKGLSGVEHEGYFSHPAERVTVTDMRFCDTTKALLTLDDGRELIVHLVAAEEDVGEGGHAAIRVVLDDPDLASIPREELRKRIRPLLEGAEWISCWPSEVTAAVQAATDKAVNSLDLWTEEEEDVPEELRGETLLHRLAKQILSEQSRLRVPAICLAGQEAEGSRAVMIAEQTLVLGGVIQEKAIGAVRPDLFANLAPEQTLGEKLLIEITVTNPLTEERRRKIRDLNLPCLEIDLRGFVGRISLDEYTALLCERIDGKSWAHHPRMLSVPELEGVSLDELGIPDLGTLYVMPLKDVVKRWHSAWIDAFKGKADDGERLVRPWELAMRNKNLQPSLAQDHYGKILLARLYDISKIQLEPSSMTFKQIDQVVFGICEDVSVGNRQFRPLYLAALKPLEHLLSRNALHMLGQLRLKVHADMRGDYLATYDWKSEYDELLQLLYPDLQETIRYVRRKVREAKARLEQSKGTTPPPGQGRLQPQANRNDPEAYRRAKGAGRRPETASESNTITDTRIRLILAGKKAADLGQSPIEFAEHQQHDFGRTAKDIMKLLRLYNIVNDSNQWRGLPW